MELNFNILKVWISVSNLYTGGCSSVSWIQSFVSSVDFVSYLWTNCWAGNISINEQIPLSEPYKTYTTLWIIERAEQNSLQLHTQLDTWYFLASHVYLLLGLPDVFCLVSELIDTREYIFLHFSSSLFMITWNVWFFSDILTTYLDKLHVMLILNLSIWVFFLLSLIQCMDVSESDIRIRYLNCTLSISGSGNHFCHTDTKRWQLRFTFCKWLIAVTVSAWIV